MSNIIIADGTGTGNKLKINEENRLQSLSITESIAAHHAFEGEAYNINTGTISLTSDNKSALLYLKNNEDQPLIITAFFYLLGNATNNSGDTLVQIERNPTGGTLTTFTDLVPVNRDFSSAKTLDVTCKLGAEGKTLTGADAIAIESIFTGQGRQVLSVGAVVLRKGNSVGITMTPASGTTAQDVQMAMAVYRATETTT